MPINVKPHTNKVFKCLLSVSINIYECNLPYILIVHSGVVYTSDQRRIQEFKKKGGPRNLAQKMGTDAPLSRPLYLLLLIIVHSH